MLENAAHLSFIGSVLSPIIDPKFPSFIQQNVRSLLQNPRPPWKSLLVKSSLHRGLRSSSPVSPAWENDPRLSSFEIANRLSLIPDSLLGGLKRTQLRSLLHRAWPGLGLTINWRESQAEFSIFPN